MDLTGLAGVWAGCHLQLARLAECPELAMEEAEARQFLLAWQNYLRHLSVEASQRTVDLATALGVTLFCYAPRGVALSKRGKAARRPPAAAAGPARIFEFRSPGAAPHEEGEHVSFEPDLSGPGHHPGPEAAE